MTRSNHFILNSFALYTYIFGTIGFALYVPYNEDRLKVRYLSSRVIIARNNPWQIFRVGPTKTRYNSNYIVYLRGTCSTISKLSIH